MIIKKGLHLKVIHQITDNTFKQRISKGLKAYPFFI